MERKKENNKVDKMDKKTPKSHGKNIGLIEK